MSCMRGNTSHSTRKTTSRASWVPRTVKRARRSRCSQSRYWAEMPGAATASTFDMDFELLPQFIEIDVELGRIAGRERRRPCRPVGPKPDRVIGFHPPRPPRQHDDAFRHADRLADVMRDQNRGLALAPQNIGDLVGERETRL